MLVLFSLIFVVSYYSYANDSFLKTFVVEETELVNMKILAIDPDGDDLYYKYSYPLDQNGQWQTDYGDRGEYIVNISISDSKHVLEEKILLIVNAKNQPPNVELQPEYWIEEGDKIKLSYNVYDFDEDPLDIYFSHPLNENGEWQTQLGDVGRYDIYMRVSDGYHSVTKKAFIIVEYKDRSPIIIDYSPKISSDKYTDLEEGDSIIFDIELEDFEDEALSITWYKNGIESSKTFSNSDSFEMIFGYDEAGKHEIKVIAEDKAGNTIEKIWNLNIMDKNRLPKLNITEITVYEGEEVVIDIPSVDADGDTITYKISEPVGNNKRWQTNYDDSGRYEVLVELFDGKEVINQTMIINVIDVDRPPVIPEIQKIEISEGYNNINLICYDHDGDDISYKIELFDKSGNLILIDSLVDIIEIEKNIGWKLNISFNISYDYISRKNFFNRLIDRVIPNLLPNKNEKLLFECCGKDKCTQVVYSLNIEDTNRKPVLFVDNVEIDNLLNLYTKEGEEFILDYYVYDYDGDSVNIQISDPLGNNAKKYFDYGDAGKYRGHIILEDPFDKTIIDYVINVEKINQNPSMYIKHPFYINENETVEISVDTFDPDGDEVIVYLEDFYYPYEYKDGKINFSVFHDYVNHTNKTPSMLYKLPKLIRNILNKYLNQNDKELNFKIVAKDNEAYIYQNVSMLVSDVNQKPVFLKTYPEYKTFKVNKGVIVDFSADVVDYDGDKVVYTWELNGKQKMNTSSELQIRFTTPGIKNIKLIADDGYEKSEYSWKILVK